MRTLPLLLLLATTGPASAQEPPRAAPVEHGPPRGFDGIHPHLASFNSSNECGIGALVPWAGRLWWITYAPHAPRGSDDKLYSIDATLALEVHPESVGGTPAGRMIHRESEQLFLGPYVLDARGRVRVLPPATMPGRITGYARHLSQPAEKVYAATMEEGFYEIAVEDLAVRELFPDANGSADPGGALLPGYHGKGLYSGQGRLIYANNGEHSAAARTRPDIPSGVLAEWDAMGPWKVIERLQFTEVTGPGGLTGNAEPRRDPIWSIGWDHRSLILVVRASDRWWRYRLPKGSHAYDGAHGWNTEWPRIRDIGEEDLLMTMHGLFWRFPRGFRPTDSAGLVPRSAYLKVVGDFCRWGDQLALGTDDAARSEFLNRRRAKGRIAGPVQSQSNLWFVAPERLDHLGPALGRGALWIDEAVPAGEPSDPFLVAGYRYRGLHLVNHSEHPVELRLELDRRGNDTWDPIRTVPLAPRAALHLPLGAEFDGIWLRASTSVDARLSLWFGLRSEDERSSGTDALFEGLARAGEAQRGGLLRAGSQDEGLHLVEHTAGGSEPRAYRLTPELHFVESESSASAASLAEELAIPHEVLVDDGDSLLYVDDDGARFRLPRVQPQSLPGLAPRRVCREVVTERDLFHAGGTFFELPARNAGGFAHIRPIASHPFWIEDYASWRGLLVLSGVRRAEVSNPRIVASEEGAAAVWLGSVDEIWKLGKPRGSAWLWKRAEVKVDERTDPLLMTGYDQKLLRLLNHGGDAWRVMVEVDPGGTGSWYGYRELVVMPGPSALEFPREFEASWVRLWSRGAGVVSAGFEYR